MNPQNCVLASYTVQETFKIPKDINLDIPGVKWWIRWRVLHIETPDGEKYEVDGEEVENDYKTPDEIEIEHAYDWSVVYAPDEQTSTKTDSEKEEFESAMASALDDTDVYLVKKAIEIGDNSTLTYREKADIIWNLFQDQKKKDK
jgi:hypothetical protein